MVVIIDYSMGNLHSVANALSHLGHDCKISADPADIREADRLILPGVGAFPDAMKALSSSGLDTLIREEALADKPLLGICLGMQLLFEASHEFAYTKGLGLIEGEVRPIRAPGLKIPHIGWNSVAKNQPHDPLVRNLDEGAHVYFVHSFCADTDPGNVVLYTEYGQPIPALVKSPRLRVWGAQFHPEKSHSVGLAMLDAFCHE